MMAVPDAQNRFLLEKNFHFGLLDLEIFDPRYVLPPTQQHAIGGPSPLDRSVQARWVAATTT